MLLACYLTLSSYVAVHVAIYGEDVPGADSWKEKLIMRATIILWEIATPFAFLVSGFVRYAILPSALKDPSVSTSVLKNPFILMLHNLSTFIALVEHAILTGLPVRWSDASLAPLVGCVYVIFSWNITMLWSKPEHGPQFVYLFLDTTLPGWTPSIVIITLLIVLLLFYGLFCSIEQVLTWLGGGVISHIVFVAVMSSLFMRFRDLAIALIHKGWKS